MYSKPNVLKARNKGYIAAELITRLGNHRAIQLKFSFIPITHQHQMAGQQLSYEGVRPC